MKIDDVKALWAIRRHAANDAARRVAQADAQRAAADRALATYRTHVGDEVERAEGFGLSQSLALWYDAAARRLHDLETAAVERAAQAAAAWTSLRGAMTEAERVGTVCEQLDAQRRARTARHAQDRLDALALRRRPRQPES